MRSQTRSLFLLFFFIFLSRHKTINVMLIALSSPCRTPMMRCLCRKKKKLKTFFCWLTCKMPHHRTLLFSFYCVAFVRRFTNLTFILLKSSTRCVIDSRDYTFICLSTVLLKAFYHCNNSKITVIVWHGSRKSKRTKMTTNGHSKNILLHLQSNNFSHFFFFISTLSYLFRRFFASKWRHNTRQNRNNWRIKLMCCTCTSYNFSLSSFFCTQKIKKNEKKKKNDKRCDDLCVYYWRRNDKNVFIRNWIASTVLQMWRYCK